MTKWRGKPCTASLEGCDELQAGVMMGRAAPAGAAAALHRAERGSPGRAWPEHRVALGSRGCTK